MTTLSEHPDFQTYAELCPHLPSGGPSSVRSWIGGMPEMAPDQKWPKGADGVPYVFLLQVCCADLPDDLWGGIGPREGWVLLFAHPTRSPVAFKLLHCLERGPARHEGTETRVHWANIRATSPDVPTFTRLPVHPVARRTGEGRRPMATPDAPPEFPSTYGAMVWVLDALSQHLPNVAKPGDPQTPRQAEALENAKRHKEAIFALLDAEGQALQSKAWSEDKAIYAAVNAHNGRQIKVVEAWRARAAAEPPGASLPPELWPKCRADLWALTRAYTKTEKVRDVIPPGSAPTARPLSTRILHGILNLFPRGGVELPWGHALTERQPRVDRQIMGTAPIFQERAGPLSIGVRVYGDKNPIADDLLENLLERYWRGDLAASECDLAQGLLAQKSPKPPQMGGLPFYTDGVVDPMGLFGKRTRNPATGALIEKPPVAPDCLMFCLSNLDPLPGSLPRTAMP